MTACAWRLMVSVSSASQATRNGLTGVVETCRRNAEALVRTATQTISTRGAQPDLGGERPEFTPSTRASMDGQVAADLTFADFLAGKGNAFKNEVQGKGEADLWRAGKMTLQQLLDQRGNPLTLERLRAKYQ